MTSNDFFKTLVGAGFSWLPFNSNNAWGFGGGHGDRFERGPVVVKTFVASFRHLPSTHVVTVTVAGRRVFDELQGAKAFARAAEIALASA